MSVSECSGDCPFDVEGFASDEGCRSRVDRTATVKTVVLTGEMVSFAFKDSDALFNLGTAIGSHRHSGGCYIAMNGT